MCHIFWIISSTNFKSIKFDGSNAHQIQQLLNDNREEIIRETFRNKLNLYRNYCNTNQLFQEAKECCRLLGYYIDMPKKGKSLAYNFNLNNFAGTDDEVFDFIPFAFQGVRDFFFVNDNVELENLYKTNSILRTCMPALFSVPILYPPLSKY